MNKIVATTAFQVARSKHSAAESMATKSKHSGSKWWTWYPQPTIFKNNQPWKRWWQQHHQGSRKRRMAMLAQLQQCHDIVAASGYTRRVMTGWSTAMYAFSWQSTVVIVMAAATPGSNHWNHRHDHQCHHEHQEQDRWKLQRCEGIFFIASE